MMKFKLETVTNNHYNQEQSERLWEGQEEKGYGKVSL